MIHTSSTDEFSMLDLAKNEIEIYLKYGVVPAHPTNPVEGCADANPKLLLNDT